MMEKRTFAAALLAIVTAATAGSAVARADGCEVLRERVLRSVHASATEFGSVQSSLRSLSSARAGAVGSLIAGPQSCANSVEVTTRAFSEALGALNMPVTWDRRPMDRGDYCLGGNLSQCYPSQRLHSSLAPNQLAFVYDAWKGVRNAVAMHMPFGTSSRLARFTPESLDLELASSLAHMVEGPLYSSYEGMHRR